MAKPIVGLFGTCGNSTWRRGIIEQLHSHGFSYFNPQRSDWKHEHIVEENYHLNNDDVILFVVTKETTGFGSLGEIGFSVLNASQSSQKLIILIDDDCDDPNADSKALKESINTRALVKTKVKNLINEHHSVFLAESMTQLIQQLISFK